jgi:hypothetical protein
MQTIRQIEKLWDTRKYSRLLHDLVAYRLESCVEAELIEHASANAAALALIRLDEMYRPDAQICIRLTLTLIAMQEKDGGWGDAITTALVLRALMLSDGEGETVERGLAYLANLQQPGGAWPRVALRRMPADGAVSAFVMLQLADKEQFRSAVDFQSAVAWFASNAQNEDAAVKGLWSMAKLRAETPVVEKGLFELVN